MDAVMVFTAELDAVSRSRKGRSFGTRLYSVLQTVRDFTGVIDTFVSSHPDIAALVWGSVKLTMLVVANYISYFEEISNLFMRLKDHCPRFEEYRALYPTSERLQSALCKFHASVVDCCTHVVEVLQRSKAKRLLNSLHQGFSKEFAPDVTNIENFGKEVKEEISLAQATAQRQHQELQMKEAEASRNGFLSVLSTSKITAEELREMRLQRDELLSNQARLQLLRSISSYDNRRPYKEACQKRHHSTAEWIFSTDEFKRWRTHSGSPVLWCTGKIGSGKTVITASAINHIARTKESNEKIAYFFLQFDNSESLHAETIVRSIIRQLLDVTAVPQNIELKLKSMDPNLFTNLGDWEKLLTGMITSFKLCSVFVDALDECELEEQRKILNIFSALTATVPGLKIFIASRLSVRKELERAFPNIGYISMESEGIMNDISIYVDEMLQKRIEFGDLQVSDPCLIDEIKLKLVRHADGMFLWITYLIDEVCSQVYDEDIRRALEHLPKNLEETYYRALSRILGSRVGIVQRVFLWVTVAKRNLTLGELSGAVAVEVGQKSLNPNRQFKDEDRLIYWCENLLHLDEEHDTVQFSHRTIYDFITGECSNTKHHHFHVRVKKADSFAGEICITYLSLNDFKTTVARRTQPKPMSPVQIALEAVGRGNYMGQLVRKCLHRSSISDQETHSMDLEALASYQRSSGGLEEMKQMYPFLEYASEHWISHTTGFSPKSTAWELWKYIATGDHDLAQVPWQTRDFSSLEILQWAIRKRHCGVLSLALPLMRDAGSFDGGLVIKQAIREMARSGATKALDILIPYSRSPEYIDNALLAACAAGHLNAVDRLLAANANMETSDGRFSAVTAACSYVHSRVLNILLEKGAQVNPDPQSPIDSPLQAAAGAGHLDIVLTLLAAGANVNVPRIHQGGNTALASACAGGHLGIVRCLLAAKADTNALGRWDCTPLQAAAEGGHLQAVESLIKAGAKINAVGENDQTPLQAAANNGHLAIVKHLLAAGVNVSVSGRYFGTALEAACKNGYLDVIDCLIAVGTDINGTSALQAASREGHLAVVERFTAAKDMIDEFPYYAGTALQVASGVGHLDIVKHLKQAGADENVSGEFGRTALQNASAAGHIDIVEYLIAENADVRPLKVFDNSSLCLACIFGHAEVVQRLIAAGADVDEAGFRNQTPLHYAAEQGHLNVVRCLIAAGADVDAVGYGSQTVLHYAASNGYLDVVECLLAANAKADGPVNDHGVTPLQAAFHSSHDEVVSRLIASGANLNDIPPKFRAIAAMKAPSKPS